MSENDIPFFLGIAFGLVAGYFVGHGRGYVAGVDWCTKRLDEVTAPPSPIGIAESEQP